VDTAEHAVSFSGFDGVPENCEVDVNVQNYINTGSTRPPIDTHAGCGHVKIKATVTGCDGNAVNIESPFVEGDFTLDYAGQAAVSVRSYAVEPAEIEIRVRAGTLAAQAVEVFKPAGASVATPAYLRMDVRAKKTGATAVVVTDYAKVVVDDLHVGTALVGLARIDSCGHVHVKSVSGDNVNGNAFDSDLCDFVQVDAWDLPVLSSGAIGLILAGATSVFTLGRGYVNAIDASAIRVNSGRLASMGGCTGTLTRTAGTPGFVVANGGGDHIISGVNLLSVSGTSTRGVTVASGVARTLIANSNLRVAATPISDSGTSTTTSGNVIS
jgi:hypothetical protein